MANFSELVKTFNKNLSIINQNKLVISLNESFNEEEKRLYATNLYMYMNYHPTDDFPIDLEDVYSMIGFTRKDNARRILDKNFTENNDYKVYEGDEANSAPLLGGALNNETNRVRGCAGQNKQRVMLNTDTFKNLCMIARTENGKKIRKYYVKLENVFNSILKQEMEDQLKNKDLEYYKRTREKEDAAISQFSVDDMCIYLAELGIIDEKRLVKFGHTNDLKSRISSHRKNFKNFNFIVAYKVENSKKFEKLIKDIPDVKSRRRTLEVNNVKHNEIVEIDEYYTLKKLIKDVVNMIENNSSLELAQLELKKIQEQEQTKREQELTKQAQEKTKQEQIKLEMMKLSMNKLPFIETPIVDDLINFEENEPVIFQEEVEQDVPQRQLAIPENEDSEEEKYKFFNGRPIYSLQFYKDSHYGPLNYKKMYLESIKYVENSIHELFYNDNPSNYLCRSNFYILNSNKKWEFRNKYEMLEKISIYTKRIVKNIINIYEQVMCDSDLKSCEKLCMSKQLCLRTFDELQYLYFKRINQTDYDYFDEKIHKEKKFPQGRLHLKFKPFPVTFKRKRYLEFIYDNFIFTDDDQWPLPYLIVERYMKYEKVFYYKTDIQEIKILLSSLCSGCILK